MAYFVEHNNQAINLDVVERIRFKEDFHADEYSITFHLPSGDITWLMDEKYFKEIKELIRKTMKDA